MGLFLAISHRLRKPRIDPASNASQRKLFDAGSPRLLEFIDTRREFVKLADSIDWEIFEEYWRKHFRDAGGQMASSGRRVAGLVMIQHRQLIDPATLAKWRRRLGRELERQPKVIADNTIMAIAELLISLAKRLIAQTRNPKQKDKIYALHEPDVDRISKGKARKRFEFGAKVGIVCTKKDDFVIGMRNCAGNPCDWHTLDDMHCQAEAISRLKAKTAAVDLDYRGRHEKM